MSAFGEEQRALIEGSEFFFLATAHEGSVDCSFKGGPAGFVQVTGPVTLEWPDFDGNSMYRSLGTILKSGRAGLLFVRFDGSSYRLRVNGTATLIYDHPRLADYPAAKAMIRVDAHEIFPNCPRYIPDLSANQPSEYLPKAGEPVPKPVWKDRDYIRPLLATTDPHKDSQ